MLLVRPRTDRDWVPEHDTFSATQLIRTDLSVRDLRDDLHPEQGVVEPRSLSVTFPLTDVQDVWLAQSPFKKLPSAAHTMLIFRFKSGRTLAWSFEARREEGEAYDIWAGMFRRYEAMVVWATERDVLTLRAVERGDRTELYKLSLSPLQARDILAELVARSEALRQSPTFYHTLTYNCATELVSVLRDTVAPSLSILDSRVLFSASMPEVLREVGLIESALPLEQLRAEADVTARVRQAPFAADFSTHIRGE
jgi:hypothetical protein